MHSSRGRPVGERQGLPLVRPWVFGNSVPDDGFAEFLLGKIVVDYDVLCPVGVDIVNENAMNAV